jgi:uncharacterized protein YdeI (YjbR/CyaY-like superfamily)
VNTFSASTTADWRVWLAQNFRSEKEVWLIIYHKDSGTPSVRYHEAIEYALCYGWIDSQARKRDADSSHLRFTPRNPLSTWSRVNRQRAAKICTDGIFGKCNVVAYAAKAERSCWAGRATSGDLIRALGDTGLGVVIEVGRSAVGQTSFLCLELTGRCRLECVH